ncbi:unnamed protein product, partial [Trichobilharzia regenti]
MTTTSDSKNLPNGLSPMKKKYLPSKITFMGPPMSCLEVSENVGNSITTAAYNQPITTCNSACTISTISTSSVLQKISISTTATTTTTRTWSKVVGTKFAKTPQPTSALSGNPIDESTHKASSSSSNSVWQTDQVKQIVGVMNSNNNTEPQNTHGDNMLPKTNNSSTTSDTTTKTIATTINNMQSLWSTSDDSLVNKSNNRTSKNDLNTSIPTATTTTTVISSVVSPSLSTTAAASYSSSSQISNNICKVKPQQQLLQTTAPISSSLVSNSMMSVNPLSPNNIVLMENVTNIAAATGTDMV